VFSNMLTCVHLVAAAEVLMVGQWLEIYEILPQK
jgi:hypothetical protein